jgi:hypothetical protein
VKLGFGVGTRFSSGTALIPSARSAGGRPGKGAAASCRGRGGLPLTVGPE